MGKSHHILSINSGSSSLKAACFLMSGTGEELLFEGEARSLGAPDGAVWTRVREGPERQQSMMLKDHHMALSTLIGMMSLDSIQSIEAIGHRIVHGGPNHFRPEKITSDLMQQIRDLSSLAPLHNPPALTGIELSAELFPGVPQVACFDTAFHHQMPEVARRLPLPEVYWRDGMRRYGFHGLSYEYILQTLGHENAGRLIIAHLGNGASLAAIKNGKPMDTTMSFTPIGGVMMGTRTGDLDPGILLYLLRNKDFTVDKLESFLDRECGLLGVSGITSSMADLLVCRKESVRAALAIDLFVYEIIKSIGSLVAVLGGLDCLIFSGGIGENAASIRAEICSRLEHLGIKVDALQNSRHSQVISTANSNCRVMVVPTDETLMIARHTDQIVFHMDRVS